VLSLVLGVTAAAPSTRSAALQTYVCGVGHASTWTRAGRTGTDWLVLGLDSKSGCKSARQSLATLAPKITSHAGADTQAFRALGMACVITKSTLFGACRTGNGGPGTTGIAVIGDPTRNSAVRPYVGGRTSFPALSSTTTPTTAATGDPGVPRLSPAAVTCTAPADTAAAGWAFRLPDGNLLSGNHWTVNTFAFFSDADCSAIRDLIPELETAAGNVTMDTSSFETKSWAHGSWACVAAHDVAYPGGRSSIVDVPVAGCARTIFLNGTSNADGTPSLATTLEQVVVYPNVEVGTSGTTTTEIRQLTTRVGAIRDSFEQYGISLVALNSATARRLSGPPPAGTAVAGSHAPTESGVQSCGTAATAVPSARWTHGSEHGTTWELAVNAGYPCELATAVFKTFVANLAASPDTLTAAQLDRNGWTCSANQTTLIAICKFTPEIYTDRLRAALGETVPTGFRIGIRAAYSVGATRETLSRAIQATL
jgi:hypothetical protein